MKNEPVFPIFLIDEKSKRFGSEVLTRRSKYVTGGILPRAGTFVRGTALDSTGRMLRCEGEKPGFPKDGLVAEILYHL